MSIKDTRTTTQTHPDYNDTIKPLRDVRDCVQGGWKIKRETYEYLPHPSQIDPNSKDQQARYAQYLAGAEYDEIPGLTLRSWLGKMRVGDTSVTLPERLSYLEQNADGDGTPVTAAIESCASNVFQAKYHILVADYQGLSDVDISQLSKAEAQELNPRATIKQYTRESLVDWDYRRINGAMQLGYMKLREMGYDFNPETNHREIVESFLILALDVNGNYYQQKEVDGQIGERDYPTVGGSMLGWIPAQIVSDGELPVGWLPQDMGMLYTICQLSLHRYRVSADYKEAMRYIVPTIMTKGWQDGDLQTFKDVNGGRGQMLLGAGVVNNLPHEVDYDVLAANTELEGFERYFDRNADKARASGASFKDKVETQQTATEADINAGEKNAMLETVASNLEYAWQRIISYCAMFEGLWSPDEVESRLEDIEINLPRDFATPKLSVDEARQIMDMWRDGVYTKKQVVQKLTEGGWGTGQEVEVWLSELDEESPSVTELANAGQTS